MNSEFPSSCTWRSGSRTRTPLVRVVEGQQIELYYIFRIKRWIGWREDMLQTCMKIIDTSALR